MNKIKHKTLLLILCFTFLYVYNLSAQSSALCKETYNWYFGYQAAITFNGSSTPSPTVLTNSAMSMNEGCASISDGSGNLLFYTNGLNIWDSSHSIMPNGSGLLGTGSSAQSSIAVPMPLNDSLYYVFTVMDWISGTSTGIGLNYNVINMYDDGNGNTINPLGDILLKNIPLDTNVREQVTAVYHSNCQDIWIITHKGSKWHSSDAYLAYLLTPTGLNTTPIISNVGMTYYTNNRFGYLKPSHDGKKICTTLGRGAGFQGTTVELLDFDNTTGQLSNPIIIADSANPNVWAYSSEFSPDNSILYVSAFNQTFINQYDISSGIQSTIRASKTNIATGTTNKSCLQLGPDNKIYVAKQSNSFLGVIDNPNSLTNSNYIDQSVNLGSGNAGIGLPSFWKRQFIQNYANASICQGDSILLGGNYQTITGTYNDTLFGTNVCDSCLEIITTNLQVSNFSSSVLSINSCSAYTWNGITYNSSGIFTDSSINTNGCINIDSLILNINSASFNFTADSVCQGDSVFIGGAYQTSSGVFYDTIINGAINTCDSIIETVLLVKANANANIISDSIFCDYDIATNLQANSSGGIWNGNGITDSILGTFEPTIAAIGNNVITYYISSFCGDSSDINIKVFDSPILSANTKDDSCMSSIGYIHLIVSGGTLPFVYSWDNGASSDSLFNILSGVYIITVTDSNNCRKSSLYTIGDNDPSDCNGFLWLPNIFSPNGDGVNDVLYVRGAEGAQVFSYIIFNRWGQKVFETKNYTEGWDGTFKGVVLNDGVFAYTVSATFLDGIESNISGTITLIKL